MDAKFRNIIVELKLRPWNSNYVGTQFGGSIFMMTDAFYMVMLVRNLGSKYIVWDHSATIRYLKPGRTHLTAEFQLSEVDISNIVQDLESTTKILWTRKIQIKDMQNEIIAEVDKVIYIRKKEKQISA